MREYRIPMVSIDYRIRVPYLLVSEIAITSPHDMDAPHMDDHSEEIGEEGIDGNVITSRVKDLKQGNHHLQYSTVSPLPHYRNPSHSPRP